MLTRTLGRLFRATWFRGDLAGNLFRTLEATRSAPRNLSTSLSLWQCIEAADIRPRRIPRIRETFNRGNQSLDELGTCAFPGCGEVHAMAFRCVPAHLDDFSRR